MITENIVTKSAAQDAYHVVVGGGSLVYHSLDDSNLTLIDNLNGTL